MGVYPNGYYNYLKDRKHEYRSEKAAIQRKIVEVYHENEGTWGYRMIHDYLVLAPFNVLRAPLTIYKYMCELNLHGTTHQPKYCYMKGHAHKIFPNLLNQEFDIDKPNKVWATDFTYLKMADGTVRYNCTIIDLHDRMVMASLNGSKIDADLAIRTLGLAIKKHNPGRGLILHSDQGSQFTSYEFNRFCEINFIQQSMSRAGCPYDNAPMERFFNTLKNDYYYLHRFRNEIELDNGIYDFILKYNYKRPHRHNGGLTPAAARRIA